MAEIVFVTHNKGKIESAKRILKDVDLKIFEYDLEEPRSDDISYISRYKVIEAYKLVKRPCISLDCGFWIDALNGFPRAFVNFALDTIGIEGILKLMEGKIDRSCRYISLGADMKEGLLIVCVEPIQIKSGLICGTFICLVDMIKLWQRCRKTKFLIVLNMIR